MNNIQNQVLWVNPGGRGNSENPFKENQYKDICGEIFKYCDFLTLKSLTQVDSSFRDRVIKWVRNPEGLLGYRPAPKIERRMNPVDELELLALNVEKIPIVGYFVSLPRIFGGIGLSIGFGIGQGIHRVREKICDSEIKRLRAKNAAELCEWRAKKAARNIVRGLLNSFPVVGMDLVKYSSSGVVRENLGYHATSLLRGAIKLIDWMNHVNQNILSRSGGVSYDIIQTIKMVNSQKKSIERDLDSWEFVSLFNHGYYSYGKYDDSMLLAEKIFEAYEGFSEYLSKIDVT